MTRASCELVLEKAEITSLLLAVAWATVDKVGPPTLSLRWLKRQAFVGIHDESGEGASALLEEE